MHPYAIFKVHAVDIRRARHDMDLMTQRRHAGREVTSEAANPAVIARRIFLRDETDLQSPRLGTEHAIRDKSPSNGWKFAMEPLVADALVDADLQAALDLLQEQVALGVGELAGGVMHVRRLPDAVGEGAENLTQFGERPPLLIVEDREIAMVLDVGERVEDDLGAVAAVAGEILVVDRGAGERPQSITQVDDATADIDLVHVVFDLLVEAADIDEALPQKTGVGPLQEDEGIGAGNGVGVEGRLEVEARVAEAVADGIAVLVVEAGVVKDAAAGAANVIGIVGGDQFLQPGRLRESVVVDEGHNLAVRGGDARVARLAQVDLGTMRDADVRDRGEELVGVVGGGTVDNDHFKGLISLISESVEGVPQAGRAVVGIDDDADAPRRRAARLGHVGSPPWDGVKPTGCNPWAYAPCPLTQRRGRPH